MIKRLVFFAVLVSAVSAHAEIGRICKVTYEGRDPFADPYVMEVVFVTGKELNKSTSSYNYESFSNYAVLWFEDGGVAILKIDNFVSTTGGIFDKRAFRSLFSYSLSVPTVQVNGDSEKKWEITCKESFKWIDPREK